MSLSTDEQLSLAKKQLVACLGKNEKQYWENIKAWFRHKINKEEFEANAKKLLPPAKIHLHNKFFVAVITKCHFTCTTNSSHVTSGFKGRNNLRTQAFLFKYSHEFLPMAIPSEPGVPIKPHPKASKDAATYRPLASRSPFLSNERDLFQYSCAVSWQMGLDGSSDEVGDLMMSASEIFIKNLLSSILSRRASYKVLDESFQFQMGNEAVDPYLLQKPRRFEASRIRSENSQFTSVLEEAGKETSIAISKNVKLTLYDFVNALRYYKRKMIHPAKFYSITMEKLIARVGHHDCKVLPKSKSKTATTTTSQQRKTKARRADEQQQQAKSARHR